MGWIDWHAVFMGSVNAWVYREGSATCEVRPDFGNKRWYWTVKWSKQNKPPKKQPDGSYYVGEPLPSTKRWGVSESEVDAKRQAERALSMGRPKDSSGS